MKNRTLIRGNCEYCGKWYIYIDKINKDGNVKCRHCKKKSMNWSDSLCKSF